MRRIFALFLCTGILLSLFSGCSFWKQEPEIQLTQEQLDRIDLIVAHREEWKEVSDEFHSYPVNEIDIAEYDIDTSDYKGAVTIMHVAYIEKGKGAGEYYYHTEAYAVYGSVFRQISPLQELTSVRVDLPNLSDDALKQTLQDAYIKYLSKN